MESSGRLGEKPHELSSADNLMLFDAEHEFTEGNRNPLHASRSNNVPPEKLSQVDGVHRTREHGDSAAFGRPRKAYKRRYRSRPNRDATRSSSSDVNPTRGSLGTTLPPRHGPRDAKGLISSAENNIASKNCNSNPTSSIDGAVHKIGLTDSQQDTELDGGKTTLELTKDQIEGVLVDAVSDVIASEIPLDDHHNQQARQGVAETPIRADSDGLDAIKTIEELSSAVVECQPSANAMKVENASSSCQMNGFSNKKEERMEDGIHNSSASCGIKGVDLDVSSTQTCLIIAGNSNTELYTKITNADSNPKIYDKTLVPEQIPFVEGDESLKQKKETGTFGSSTLVNVKGTSAGQSERDNGFKIHLKDELNQSGFTSKNMVKDQSVIEGTEVCEPSKSESGRKPADALADNCGLRNENSFNMRHQVSIDITEGGLLNRVSTVSLEAQTSSGADSSLAGKVDEDSILKEAQIIEVYC